MEDVEDFIILHLTIRGGKNPCYALRNKIYSENCVNYHSKLSLSITPKSSMQKWLADIENVSRYDLSANLGHKSLVNNIKVLSSDPNCSELPT